MTTNTQFVSALDGVVAALSAANVAIPVIMSTAASLIGIWRASTGDKSISLSEYADRIERKLKENDTYIRSEIEAARALIAARQL